MTPPEIHPQQERENPEPQERTNPMPWSVMVLAALLLAFGVMYIARSSVGDHADRGDGRTTAELQGSATAAAGTAIDGAAVFASRCSACHQANGAGLPGVFPPLAGSEWVSGNESTLIALVLHGINGSLTVKGNVYQGAMPAFGTQLPDAELAAVLTYVRSNWGNTGVAVNAAAVTSVRKQTSARTESFKGDAELGAPK